MSALSIEQQVAASASAAHGTQQSSKHSPLKAASQKQANQKDQQPVSDAVQQPGKHQAVQQPAGKTCEKQADAGKQQQKPQQKPQAAAGGRSPVLCVPVASLKPAAAAPQGPTPCRPEATCTAASSQLRAASSPQPPAAVLMPSLIPSAAASRAAVKIQGVRSKAEGSIAILQFIDACLHEEHKNSGTSFTKFKQPGLQLPAASSGQGS